MSKFELAFDIIVGFVFYGVICSIGGFFALLILTSMDIEPLLWSTGAIGLTAAILGAAVPFLRKAATVVLSLFAPSLW